MVDQGPPAIQPPLGRYALPADFIERHKKARIISALAEATVEKGYRAVTVADIVRRAGISRNTFYETFGSKEECFLGASGFGVEEAVRRVLAAATPLDAWPDRVNVGLAAFLHYVASEPALARTCIVEALSAGPAAVERYEASIEAFEPFFRMGRAESERGEELPARLEATIVGGIFWVIYQRLVMGQSERVEELLPELVEFSLQPYLGREAAKQAAAQARPQLSG